MSARVMEQGFDLLEGPVRRVATLDTPIPFSPVLEKAAIPNPDKIVVEPLKDNAWARVEALKNLVG